jgi:hypothetical protein
MEPTVAAGRLALEPVVVRQPPFVPVLEPGCAASADAAICLNIEVEKIVYRLNPSGHSRTEFQ